MTAETKIRKVYRFPPCPNYDVEALESWLTELASEGLLFKDITLGFFVFERTTPQAVRYRLDAVQCGKSILDDNSAPASDMLEIAESCGWKFVTKYSEFYIYCSADPAAPELNTDPQVQALSFNALKKRVRRSLIFTALESVLILGLLFPQLFMSMLTMGSVFVVCLLVGLLCTIADSIIMLRHLRRLQKKLRDHAPLEHKKPWRPGATRFRIKSFGYVVLFMFLLYGYGNYLIVERLALTDTYITEYTGNIPFVTLEQLAADGEAIRNYSGTVRTWSDILAPVNIDWTQFAIISGSGEKERSASIRIRYHETCSPFVARQVASGFHRNDETSGKLKDLLGRKNWFADKQPPILDADFILAYVNHNGDQTIIIQKGNAVVKASGRGFPTETWASAMAAQIP